MNNLPKKDTFMKNLPTKDTVTATFNKDKEWALLQPLYKGQSPYKRHYKFHLQGTKTRRKLVESVVLLLSQHINFLV
jgi:hypothetical protein